MLKGTLKNFLIILIFILSLLLADFIFYSFDYFKIVNFHKSINAKYPDFNYKYKLENFYSENILSYPNEIYRNALNVNSKKKAIYIFGCSYAYGLYLKDNETFGAELAKLTGKPVYNFAMPGKGVKEFLYLSENMNFSKLTPPDYIIYVYIDNQILRMLNWNCTEIENSYIPKYKIVNNKLVLSNSYPSFLYTIRKINHIISKNKVKNNKYKKENFELFKKHVTQASDALLKSFPNAKFIVLVYDENPIFGHPFQNFENKNIIVIKASDLTKENLKSEQFMRPDFHPTAHAWKVLTPLFIKKSGIK